MIKTRKLIESLKIEKQHELELIKQKAIEREMTPEVK